MKMRKRLKGFERMEAQTGEKNVEEILKSDRNRYSSQLKIVRYLRVLQKGVSERWRISELNGNSKLISFEGEIRREETAAGGQVS